jgi:hypothetical protein
MYGDMRTGLDLDASDIKSHTPADEEIMHKIDADQQSQVRHDGVDVPLHSSPFHDEHAESDFFLILGHAITNEVIPVGYGIHPEEWEDGAYPQLEQIRVGKRRSGKSINVSLDDPIWRSRALLWVQALNILARFNIE